MPVAGQSGAVLYAEKEQLYLRCRHCEAVPLGSAELQLEPQGDGFLPDLSLSGRDFSIVALGSAVCSVTNYTNKRLDYT